MRILYVAMQFDYGVPERGLSFEENNFYKTLVADGHEVVRFDFMALKREMSLDRLNDELILLAKRTNPDVLLSIMFEFEIYRKTIEFITQSLGIPTVNWFCDDHWRFNNFSKYYATSFSAVATTDERAVERYNQLGQSKVILSQWACNHHDYYPILDDSWNYEVTFVGQPHGNRGSLVSNLKKHEVNIDVWGRGWGNGRISQDDMIKLFSNSHINLNLANSSFSWKSLVRGQFAKMFRKQIKARPFEVIGCGGFLISEWAEGIEEYFIPDKEIVLYSSFKELVEKIEFYSNDDTARRQIAKSGYNRVIREHTYSHRFKQLFGKMGLEYENITHCV